MFNRCWDSLSSSLCWLSLLLFFRKHFYGVQDLFLLWTENHRNSFYKPIKEKPLWQNPTESQEAENRAGLLSVLLQRIGTLVSVWPCLFRYKLHLLEPPALKRAMPDGHVQVLSSYTPRFEAIWRVTPMDDIKAGAQRSLYSTRHSWWEIIGQDFGATVSLRRFFVCLGK